MKKKVLSTVVFLLILALLWGGAYEVLSFKYDDGILSMKYMYRLKDDLIDVLFVGSSHAYMDLNTQTFFDEYGIASYVLAGSGQTFWNSYYYIKEALEFTTPRLIMLEGYAASRTAEYKDHGNVVKNTFGIRTPWNRAAAIFASVKWEDVDDYLFGYRIYHSRYNDITRVDFPSEQARAAFRYYTGVMPVFGNVAYDAPDVGSYSGTYPIVTREEIYFRKIIELCQEKHVPIMVFISPYVLDYRNQQCYRQLEQIAAEYGVEVWNYNSEEEYARMGLDFQTDMKNVGHLNWTGATKFSRVLGEDILTARPRDLPDRRGNPKYEYWERSNEYFTELENNRELKNSSSVKELLGNIHDSTDLVTYIYTSTSARQFGDEMELFSGLGIQDYVPQDGDLFRIDPDGVRLVSGDGPQWSYSEDLHDHTLYANYSLKKDGSWLYAEKSLVIDGQEYMSDPEGIYIMVYNTFTRRLECAKRVNFDENGSPVMTKL